MTDKKGERRGSSRNVLRRQRLGLVGRVQEKEGGGGVGGVRRVV